MFRIKRVRDIVWEKRPRSPSYLLRKEVTLEDFVPSAPRIRRLQTEDQYYSRDRGVLSSETI